MKPFLKWAGNKYQIINEIKNLLPPGQCLIEPFLGSGAVFLNTDYPHYLLADINPDLINLYSCLQQEGLSFITYCRSFFTADANSEQAFYNYRREFNTSKDLRYKAALFLYLNKHGYNGLCRYNSGGGFNVPFGRYKSPYFPETEMVFFYEKAQKAQFICADFTAVLEKSEPGSVVYADPPYVPLSDTANFTAYSATGFGQDQQQRLAVLARQLSDRGIPVLLSNHATAFTRQAYAGARIKEIPVQRYISCNGNKRGKAKEILALFT